MSLGESNVHLRLIGRGLQTAKFACTLCESKYVRLSRHRTPWLLRLVGLALFRCQSCRRLFLLPRRFVSADVFGSA